MGAKRMHYLGKYYATRGYIMFNMTYSTILQTQIGNFVTK